ncbi:MAG: type I restriction enzyme HsdR N-terminal domain-containing protein [Mangrovibacterium sp.]
MQQLNLPKFDFRLKNESNKTYIFDEIRQKFIVLTPEEWVRQHFIKYLNEHLHYPASLMNVEGGLKLNGNSYRADLLIYNRNGEPLMLVEFKAASVKISQETFQQISRYNMIYRVPYLLVSNGMQHYCCRVNFEKNSFEFLSEIPLYGAL